MHLKSKTYLGREATEKCKNELTKGKGKILVKEVTKEDGHPMVGPATMYQQQSFKVPEKKVMFSACTCKQSVCIGKYKALLVLACSQVHLYVGTDTCACRIKDQWEGREQNTIVAIRISGHHTMEKLFLSHVMLKILKLCTTCTCMIIIICTGYMHHCHAIPELPKGIVTG